MSGSQKTAVVMSSFVAASRVGATASAFCLRRLGVETLVLPTVLLGRHPGWGAPGGGPVDIAQLTDMWQGIKAQELHIDAVMTGYMASAAHVRLAADIIRHVRKNNPRAIILVDPVMGDHGRLYIAEGIAKAIRESLLPLADICTPNLWELAYLCGDDIDTAEEAVSGARGLPSDVLVTSVPFGDEIGALLSQSGQPTFAVTHEKFKSVPHGGGDALAGTFLAHRLRGYSGKDSLAQSVASIFEIITAAAENDVGEMPLIRAQDALITAAPLNVKEI